MKNIDLGLTLDIVDIRELKNGSRVRRIEEALKNKKHDKSFWIIDNSEPLDCYNLLIEQEFHFETYLVSTNECRVFVGNSY